MAQFRFHTVTLDTTTAQGIVSQIGLETARRAYVTAGTNPIRYTYDGTTPTPGSVGHYLVGNATVDLVGADLVKKLRLIATTGTSTCFITTEAP